ncbi:MAG: thiamine pyrophosphate-binding protein [Ruminococcaceae bacterium]|nr:thiamine pyrophosphate-binding protein [Oscillospiraceae bacterium]
MSTIKVSDYISRFLVEQGIRDLFLISGGGMMHLLDSAKRQEGLNLVFNLNEQASAICADSYAQFNGHLGAAMVTTGPGATNAVTGCAGAWVDSTPVLYISGQCKTSQMGQLMGLRIYGAQEIAIVPCVKAITKYAVTVLKKEEIRYHLEKAVYLATHGRKGPVWIDVPLDVQGAVVSESELVAFDPAAEGLVEESRVKEEDILRLYELLNAAKRPAILIGHGVVSAGRQERIRRLAEEFSIPVLATWRAKGVFGDEEALFMGSPGIPTTRFSNYVLQNTDFLLMIGTRLNPAVTAYDEPHFAPHAKKIMVDIEEREITKLDIDFVMSFAANAAEFLDAMERCKAAYKPCDRSAWLAYCTRMKEKYPLNREKQPLDNEGKVDGFLFADKLSDYSKASDVFVGSSSGRTCGISHMAYRLKRGQRFVTSMGIGSMGWCLPSAISCCVASGKQRTLLLEGDGSLQHNIQELALIRKYKLPLKLFIWANNGYASIYTMQMNNFQSRYAGCNAESGLAIPPMEKIAALYDLPYYKIESNEQIDAVLSEIMKDNEPCLCELCASINFDEIPKSMTIANPDGSFTSSKLENLYPFVSKEEQAENMPKWEDA